MKGVALSLACAAAAAMAQDKVGDPADGAITLYTGTVLLDCSNIEMESLVIKEALGRE
jgi:hypothetical protein